MWYVSISLGKLASGVLMCALHGQVHVYFVCLHVCMLVCGGLVGDTNGEWGCVVSGSSRRMSFCKQYMYEVF